MFIIDIDISSNIIKIYLSYYKRIFMILYHAEVGTITPYLRFPSKL